MFNVTVCWTVNICVTSHVSEKYALWDILWAPCLRLGNLEKSVWSILLLKHREGLSVIRVGLRHVGTLSKLKIWCSLNQYSLNFFHVGQGWQNFFRAQAKLRFNYLRNSVTWWNLTVLAPYLWLFQWSFSILYRLVPQAAAQLTHPLVQPSL